MRAASMLLPCVAAALLARGAAAQDYYQSIYSPTGPDQGVSPTGDIATDGPDLFVTSGQGSAASVYGAVVELSPRSPGQPGPRVTTIFQFTSKTLTGAYPGGVVRAANGVLFGTTLSGGAVGGGTAYMLTPPSGISTAWTQTLLNSFNGFGDGSPNAGLYIGAGGVLYGSIFSGANDSSGSIYSLTPDAGSTTGYDFAFVHRFAGGAADGANPDSGVIGDAHGNLYGTSAGGGAANGGTVYELSPPAGGSAQWREQVLASFSGLNGTQPASTLVFGPDGALYGTTYAGGTKNQGGSVFRLAQADGAWVLTTLFSFDDLTATTGSRPAYSVAFGSDGALYGTTVYGGANGKGVAFKLTPSASGAGEWTETVVHSFGATSQDGQYPSSNLLALSGGRFLFGATGDGGPGGYDGSVYGLKP